MYPLVEDMSKIYARPLPRVYAIFLFAIEYSAKAQHTTTGARAGGRHTGSARGGVGRWGLLAPPPVALVCLTSVHYSMANRKIAYTLGRGRAYIFDMSSTSGYMGETYFQEVGPRFCDMLAPSRFV